MIHHIFCKLVGDRNKSIIWIQDQIAYVHCTVDYMYLLITWNLIVCLQTLGPITVYMIYTDHRKK